MRKTKEYVEDLARADIQKNTPLAAGDPEHVLTTLMARNRIRSECGVVFCGVCVGLRLPSLNEFS